MTKYDMTAIRYLEHGFLPLARNRKSYICPNCGSGSGKKWFRHDFQGWGVLEMLEQDFHFYISSSLELR